MSPELADINFQDILPVHILEKCWNKWSECRDSWCLPRQLQSFVSVDTQPQHSSSSSICTRTFCQQMCIPDCPWQVVISKSTPESLYGAPVLEGGAHSCIPKGILRTYYQLNHYFKDQKDGV